MSTKKLAKVLEDSFGPVEIPAQAHWGCRTARWAEQSKQLEGRFQESVHPLLLDGLLQVFKAKLKLGLAKERDRDTSKSAEQANLAGAERESLIPVADLARIKSQVCDEMLNGQWRQEIIVDPLLSQGGEAILDNINEVVSGRSAEILGLTYEELMEKYPPGLSSQNGSVPNGPSQEGSLQSSGELDLNGQDLFIASVKLALITATRELSSALLDLERLLRRKSLELEKQLRELNREEEDQLLAAREFNNFGNAAERAMRRLTEARERLLELSFRGDRYRKQDKDKAAMVSELTFNTGLKFKLGEEMIGSGHVTSALADLAGVTTIIKELALDLVKVGQCLRQLADINCDSTAVAALLTSCLQVQGSELTICLALQSNLPPNGAPALALASNTLLKTIDQLRAAVRNFNKYCIARVELAGN